MKSTHRIALISDLHGNAIALREVLRAIRDEGVDSLVCLGDVATLGVAPGEVCDTVQQLGCRCVMGNHDEYLFDPALAREHISYDRIVESLDWCREGMCPSHLEWVRRFESGFDLELGHGHTLRLFHGSPGSNMCDLLAGTSPETFDTQLGPERATVMAGGHTHIQMMRQHKGTLVVNPGSVGAPFEQYVSGGPPKILSVAEFAIVEARGDDVSVSLRRVGLDRYELAAAFLASSNPMREALVASYS